KGIKLTGNVRLFQRTNGRWYVRFTLNGKRRMLSTGETDRTKALLKISEIVKEAELEDTLGHKVKTDVTLSELAKEYTPYAESNKAPSTLYRDKSRMRKLLETFGKKKLSEITGRDIERYMQSRRKEGKQPATVNREFALLRHMLRKAVEWDYLSGSPARTVKPFKESPGRVRYLSDSERERLLDACSGMLKAVVLTALLTGMRKGELQGLTWDDVDFERREITLKRTKNNEVRVIPISKDLLPVLHRLHNERLYSHYVFSKPDGRPYGNWHRAFETACRRAGIENFRSHDQSTPLRLTL
ncbi:tyrosine-type recombinase/integrase, partial [bacterium]|nr:tyrosine-type recombinase/integrase [bacterium]